MRLNEDGKTVRAMDVLFPGIGEIVGGSERRKIRCIEREDRAALGIDEEELWWYLDLRKFGTAVHSGFGLGFERLVQFATGMGNIRDVIPFQEHLKMQNSKSLRFRIFNLNAKTESKSKTFTEIISSANTADEVNSIAYSGF